jgi:hypothetical protein
VAAHKRIIEQLCHAGVTCSFVMLDNECSSTLQTFLHKESIKFQKTPPGIHHSNAAKRAIRTFKNHFVAGLCTVNTSFPLYLWDKLLLQAELTLNLLRGSRMNPKLSAWEHLYGIFDYNATPLGLPGTRVLVHDKPSDRNSSAPHGQDAWYIGPALHHYRCYNVWMWDTRCEREPDTLTWFPQQYTMPTPSALDIIAAGIQDIATTLNHPGPNSPLNPLMTQQAAALSDIVTIFNGVLPADDDEDTPSHLRVETKKEGEPQPASTPTLPTPTLPTADPTPPNPPPITTILPPPTPLITYADAVCHKSRCKAMPKPTTPAIVAPVPPSQHSPSKSTLSYKTCDSIQHSQTDYQHSSFV